MVRAPKASPFAFRVAERAPLSLLVAQRLRESIVSGQISVGTAFPSEKDLAQSLGVSRATVREALRILQAQGLLTGGDTVSTQRPRVTAEQTVSTAASSIENVLRLGRVPLGDLVALRVLIEGAAVAAAAERQDAAALGQAREALAAMKGGAVTLAAFRAADVGFHRALAEASGNAAYFLVMSALREAILAHLGEALSRASEPARSMAALTAEHEAILVAVERGHGKRASALVTAHIQDFYASEVR